LISATLDSSVYIRALHLGGPAALLIGHARAGNIRIDISDPILNESLRVLRDKFQWDGYRTQDARGKLLSIGNHVSPAETVSVIKEDPDDDRVLECAAAAESDFIVTEDKDLLRLGRFGNARIVTIREFVKLSLPQGKRQSPPGS
jgi:putative PIN family toxin of toxin-antitoxin system